MTKSKICKFCGGQIAEKGNVCSNCHRKVYIKKWGKNVTHQNRVYVSRLG